MEEEEKSLLSALIQRVYTSDTSDFYRTRYANALGKSAKEIDIANEFQKLPTTTWSDLVNTPFLKRQYITEKLLTKIVYKDDSSTLFARSLDDIKNEPYGIKAERPLIFLETLHEGLEKSFWYYMHNILPLINEESIELTAHIAARYEIDALVVNNVTLMQIVHALIAEGYDLSHIKNILVLDNHLGDEFLQEFMPNAHVTRLISLPETGALATQCLEGKKDETIFHADSHAFIEIQNNEIIATRLFLMPTPIIRYKTGIHAEFLKEPCACGKKSFTISSQSLHK